MRNESEVPLTDTPFNIPVADRLKRLPPYLFGRINKLKYQKRSAGIDVIDLGMGNPTDAPDPLITEKMKEALLDPKNHRYSVANGISNLRKEVAGRYFRLYGARLNPDDEVIACLGSKEGFSHMCLALMGPGDTAVVPAPTFPIHAYSVMLASGNVIALDVREPYKFLENVAYTCEHLYPKPKLVVVNFPHNPSGTCIDQDFYVDLVRLAKKYKFLVISDFAYADICFDGYKGAELPGDARGARRGGRADDHEQGIQHGGLADRVLLRQSRNGPGAGDDQGVLRLRHFPGDADRRHCRDAALRIGGAGDRQGVRGTPGRAG